MQIARLLLLALTALIAVDASAYDLRPAGVFIEGGGAQGGTRIATVGVTWPWAWRRESHWGELSGHTEAFISHWRGEGLTQRVQFNQVGVIPVLRYRFSKGQSDWFVEGGIGLSWMDEVYVTRNKQFSTRFNFVDVLGAGRNFGVDRRHELSLRVTHVSNAGIKKPNPGENLVQLRYAVRF